MRLLAVDALLSLARSVCPHGCTTRGLVQEALAQCMVEARYAHKGTSAGLTTDTTHMYANKSQAAIKDGISCMNFVGCSYGQYLLVCATPTCIACIHSILRCIPSSCSDSVSVLELEEVEVILSSVYDHENAG